MATRKKPQVVAAVADAALAVAVGVSASNVVLYRVNEGGSFHALASCAPDDAALAFKIGAAATRAVNEANGSGVPVPSLLVVREDRATDASGVTLIKQQFQQLDAASFQPLGAPVNELGKLLPKKAS